MSNTKKITENEIDTKVSITFYFGKNANTKQVLQKAIRKIERELNPLGFESIVEFKDLPLKELSLKLKRIAEFFTDHRLNDMASMMSIELAEFLLTNKDFIERIHHERENYIGSA